MNDLHSLGEKASNSPFVKIMQGDVLEQLRQLEDESVHCVVTSPPYWGLRDYSRCGCSIRSHKPGEFETNGDHGNGIFSKVSDRSCPICHGTGVVPGTEKQLGLESTPEGYIMDMVDVFREIKRVLRSDGVCWINMGDTFRDKQLVGQPWRLALALQDDGWYLRSDIIWSKPNPMPESVSDRPSKSHEYIFLLSKSGESLYWVHRDKLGSREEPEPDYRWKNKKTNEERIEPPTEWLSWWNSNPRGKNPTDWTRFNLWEGRDYFYDLEAIREPEQACTIENNQKYQLKLNKGLSKDRHAGEHMAYFSNPNGRNSRTVWEIATQPYPEAHFATFPEEIPRRCISAGSSERGCCPKCGAPWERIVEGEHRGSYHDHKSDLVEGMSQKKPNSLSGKKYYEREAQKLNTCVKMGHDAGWRDRPIPTWRTKGWRPTCSCGVKETAPCVVLDPFGGSGTTGAVAQALGRSTVLIELNPEYVKLIRDRTDARVQPLTAFDVI
jgi:DNA modification methylase